MFFLDRGGGERERGGGGVRMWGWGSFYGAGGRAMGQRARRHAVGLGPTRGAETAVGQN